MKIAILTDSSAYLTSQQLEEYKIGVIPIPLIWDNQIYRDMIDIKFEEFYHKLSEAENLPTTSQPSIGDFQEYIDCYVEQGYTDVIVITISSGISSFYSTLAAEKNNENRTKIHLFDSKVTCAGLAHEVLLAAKLVQAGADADTIIKYLTDFRDTIKVRFVVDDLKYLQRTGRLSNTASFVGSMLKIKPILAMDVQNEGKIEAIAKERQYKRAYQHIKKDFANSIASVSYPIESTVFDALDPDRKSDWLNDYEESFPTVKLESSIIGPVVGVHVGQHAIAMIWHRDIDSYFDDQGKIIDL